MQTTLTVLAPAPVSGASVFVGPIIYGLTDPSGAFTFDRDMGQPFCAEIYVGGLRTRVAMAQDCQDFSVCFLDDAPPDPPGDQTGGDLIDPPPPVGGGTSFGGA